MTFTPMSEINHYDNDTAKINRIVYQVIKSIIDTQVSRGIIFNRDNKDVYYSVILNLPVELNLLKEASVRILNNFNDNTKKVINDLTNYKLQIYYNVSNDKEINCIIHHPDKNHILEPKWQLL